MRKAFGLFLLLSVAACGGGGDESAGSGGGTTDNSLATFDVQESAADSTMQTESPPPPGAPPRPPGVSPTAAPGVAFDYRYAFRLPPAGIGAVQEKHAAACEKLGPDRCRITGMTYQQDGKEEVSAQLLLKLDPALARRFGREASDLVERADGMISSVQISGEDVGSVIDSEQQAKAQSGDALRGIEAQLAQKGRSGSERAELQRQADELRRSVRASDQSIGERRKQLATTPMAFNYTAGETDETLAGDARHALSAFTSGARVLLIVLLYLLPWMLLALALGLGVRWVHRRFLGGRVESAPTAE